jgi:hypothetical protein
LHDVIGLGKSFRVVGATGRVKTILDITAVMPLVSGEPALLGETDGAR